MSNHNNIMKTEEFTEQYRQILGMKNILGEHKEQRGPREDSTGFCKKIITVEN